MKIGFDAKRAFFNHRGLGNYSRTLIRSLQALMPEHAYHLYSPKSPSKSDLFSTDLPTTYPTQWPWTKLHSYWRSYRIHKQFEADGIDLYHGLSHELPAHIHQAGVKSVVTMHDLIFKRYPHLYQPLDRVIYARKVAHACRRADQIVAISEQTKQDLMEFMGVPAERISVIYQSCDPIFYDKKSPQTLHAVQQQYHLPTDYLLYVGAITPRKNLLTLLQALHQLSPTLQPPLVVVGQGKDYLAQAKTFIQTHHLEKQVHFISLISSADLPAIYQQAAALVYPSHFEGFGIPILEALHSGTSVITSRGSCFAEVGGDAAQYVDPNAPAKLAAVIQRVLEDSDLRAAMTQQGLLQAEQFKPEAIVGQWKELYEGIM